MTYRPRYTHEEWLNVLRVVPNCKALFGDVRPVVRVKAGSHPLRWSERNMRWECDSDFQMGELLG